MGECPIAGCDLRKATCWHLDKHLDMSNSAYRPQPQIMYTDDIDDFSMASDEPGGLWSFFKKLRKYPLNRDQIGILVRKFGLGMTNRQILEEMHWTSHDTLFRRYRAALKILKTYNFPRSKNG